MKNVKVFLVPKFMTKEELREIGIKPIATVEAEYGGKVITGEEVTLAHHTKEYQDNPAPCNTPNVPVLEDGSTIVISHMDLDTIGGVASLMGAKKEDPAFWQAAEFLDVNGVHHLHEIPEEVQDQYLAYEAWNEANRGGRIMEITDVTEKVMGQIDIIDRVIDRDSELIAEGRRWNDERQKQIEDCLVYENGNVRVFNSPTGVFCAASYYSPNLEKIIPATVTYNGKFKSVTMALADGGKKLQELGLETSRELVQKLWGMEAGGHPGIAGSPRGQEMTEEDMLKLAKLVEKQMKIVKEIEDKRSGLRIISDAVKTNDKANEIM